MRIAALHCIASQFALCLPSIVATSGLQWPTDPPDEPSSRRQGRWPVCQWPADPIRVTAVTVVPELLRVATGSWLIRLGREEPRACGCCLRSGHSASLVLSMLDDDRPLLSVSAPLCGRTKATNKRNKQGRRCWSPLSLSSLPLLSAA